MSEEPGTDNASLLQRLDALLKGCEEDLQAMAELKTKIDALMAAMKQDGKEGK